MYGAAQIYGVIEYEVGRLKSRRKADPSFVRCSVARKRGLRNRKSASHELEIDHCLDQSQQTTVRDRTRPRDGIG